MSKDYSYGQGHYDHHDHMRMDDDGGPPHVGYEADRFTRVGDFVHDSLHPTHKSFILYCEWRTSKCANRPRKMEAALLEEIDQATHEFVGECAELVDLIVKNDIEVLYTPEHRDKLIEEAGDVIFCGSWAADAWGENRLRMLRSPSEHLAGVLDLNEERGICNSRDCLKGDTEFQRSVNRLLSWRGAEIAATSGLLCNAYKKLRWQRREQDVRLQGDRVLSVILSTARILTMAGATLEDAMLSNIEKLDFRYPHGYQPDGPGGGIRTGKGA